jgi:hypothetical protein
MSTDTDTEYRYSTADVAKRLGCHRKTVGARARAAGVGIYLDGRAGMRFSERDIEQLVATLRPEPAPVKPRRKRRRRGVAA